MVNPISQSIIMLTKPLFPNPLTLNPNPKPQILNPEP